MVYDIVTSFEFRVDRSQKSNSSGTIIRKKAQNDQQSSKHLIELNDLRFGQNNSPSSGSIKKQ